LGAGFSGAAGFPLADALFAEVRAVVQGRYGADNWVERELDRYLRYRRLGEGKTVRDREVNYEDFLGFLDFEHHLGLKGKDTWSDEGNEAQLMIRAGIAQVLYQCAPPGSTLPDSYLQFAERLDTSDWVLTFNYDTLLEQALETVGRPYRLFPFRYSKVGPVANTVDDEQDELVLLKMHGSINWFDRTSYEKSVAIAASNPYPYDPRHAVFGSDHVVDAEPLCNGPRSPDDALAKVFVVRDISPLLTQPFWKWTPLILTPSTAKLLYATPLRDFWWGAQLAGGLNLGFNIVGYSQPTNDEYARQMLFHMMRNYQGYEPDFELNGRRKTKARILDFREGFWARRTLRARYQFCEKARTEYWWRGFSSDAVEWLFAD
jgi:hypothetical protein